MKLRVPLRLASRRLLAPEMFCLPWLRALAIALPGGRPPGINTEGLMTRGARWHPYISCASGSLPRAPRPAGAPAPGMEHPGLREKRARSAPTLRGKRSRSAGKKSQLCGKKLIRQPLSRKPGASFPHKSLSPVVFWIVMCARLAGARPSAARESRLHMWPDLAGPLGGAALSASQWVHTCVRRYTLSEVRCQCLQVVFSRTNRCLSQC